MAIVKVSAHDTPEIVYAPRFVGSEDPEFECSPARIRLSGAYEYVIEINPPSASQVAATLRKGAASLEDVVISELRKRRKTRSSIAGRKIRYRRSDRDRQRRASDAD